jgi:hypothetical protein
MLDAALSIQGQAAFFSDGADSIQLTSHWKVQIGTGVERAAELGLAQKSLLQTYGCTASNQVHSHHN